MSVEQLLIERSGNTCELCKTSDALKAFEVDGSSNIGADSHVLLCAACHSQASGNKALDPHHFTCLNDAMWTPIPAVQVLSWRLLTQLSSESYASNALDMLYLEDDVLAWAKAGLPDDDAEPTLDANGAVLAGGDTVTLIKDLDVKGAGFTAKRGTMVRGISLTDNPKHLEGRVNGTRVVLIAAFCKKA
ncbi:PhnA domain-containing protein [Reinekea forsetii]|nr:PhnA domain-containing protein [Reinekea forsetii]